MIFILSFIILLTNLTHTTSSSSSAGSTLFYNKRAGIDCWNEDDIIKLRARKAFEELLPAKVNPEQINGKYIRELLRYFRKTIDGVKVDDDHYVTSLLQEAVADTIGAHLRSEILPTIRFAFYAGYVPYKNTKEIHDFFKEMKMMLNTQGLGWKEPARTPAWSNLTVAKMMIGVASFLDPCSCVVLKRDKNSCIHLPAPKLDNDYEPSAIALPFKTGGLVSLTAPKSNNILLKYYTTAARCILSSSPKKCRHSDFLSFNNDMWHWMKRDVAPHLLDEKFYTAYGGVLRIAAAVQTYGKGISRRNLFEYQGACQSRWSPLKFLTQSYINVDTDWSPTLYILVVISAAVAVYLNLMLYSFICGPSCRCSSRLTKTSFSEEVGVKYTDVESEIENQEKQIKAVSRSEKSSKPRTNSVVLGCVQTQKVFDLNENTEKLMSVAMSEDESASESSSFESGDAIDAVNDHDVPQLKTSISEMTDWRKDKVVERRRSQSPMYSTSTMTYAVDPRGSGSWSDSESSTSQTGSSTSSGSTNTISKSRNSLGSRDLAWAKRVITNIRANRSN